MNEEKIHRALQLSTRSIKLQTGIELTPSEFWKLRIYYLNVLRERRGSGFSRVGNYEFETRVRFLGDLFGINLLDCVDKKLLRTEEFIEYCKSHISQWREERDYL